MNEDQFRSVINSRYTRIGGLTEKFYNDPIFYASVQILVDFLEKSELTPTELREACMVAAEIYESYHIRKMATRLGKTHEL